MEDIVAVRIVAEGGAEVFLLTWGRIQDPVDPAPLEALVLEHADQFGIRAQGAEVCATLHPAAREPYFFEALFQMSRRSIPFGDGWEAWRRAMDSEMNLGRELYFLGRERGFATPEEAARGDIPARYARPVSVLYSDDGSHAVVELATNEPPVTYPYWVACQRRSGRWFQEAGGNAPIAGWDWEQ